MASGSGWNPFHLDAPHKALDALHQIAASSAENEWVGTIYAPVSNAIVGSVEGASSQEVMIRGTEAINKLLAASAG